LTGAPLATVSGILLDLLSLHGQATYHPKQAIPLLDVTLLDAGIRLWWGKIAGRKRRWRIFVH
jgi:hypothetical protein